jgi:diguanylate cyclase (GGDEF)-like protein/putative nucleotidyltransferase with HDIG domain
MSFWLARTRFNPVRLVFNLSAPALSIWIAGTLFYATAKIGPLVNQPAEIQGLVVPLVCFAASYFLLNSGLTAVAISFERSESPFRIWHTNFAWLSLNFFGGASLAALLAVYTRDVDVTYLGIILPLLLVMHLTFKTSMARVEDANRHLQQLNSLYVSTVETLAMAIDAKDQITHGHVRRVQLYATALARALGINGEPELKAIEAAALLHDMGKLAVPEYILNKPGRLLPGEFEKMKRHASIGADILSAIDFPYPVVPIVRYHHENWDGTGYPDGLRGDEIPLGARVLAVADCFDALTSDRPYRPRLSDEEALRILRQRSGNMYEHRVVDTFIAIYRTPGVLEPQIGSEQSLDAIAASAQFSSDTRVPRLEDITASTQKMLTVHDLARSLTGRLNFADAADVIAKHVKRLVPAATCVFYIYDAQHDDLVASHASGEHANFLSGLRMPLGQRLSGWVAANRRTVVNSDPVLDLGDSGRALIPRPRSCLSTTLVTDGQLIGVLTLYSAVPQAFSEDHGRIIELVAQQVSTTVQEALRLEKKRGAAVKDSVTGLPTIQQLEEFFALTTPTGQHGMQDLSLVLVDVDHLKTINAQYGRCTGDRVLTQVVQAITQCIRGADAVFRYASDEFVILLANTGTNSSEMIAERIRKTASDLIAAGLRVESAVSLGVASAPDDGRSLEQLVAVARQRLHLFRQLSRPSVRMAADRVH